MATIQAHIGGWPALLSFEMACQYLSIDEQSLRRLATRYRTDPVSVDDGRLLWRRADLDRIIKKLLAIDLQTMREAGTRVAIFSID